MKSLSTSVIISILTACVPLSSCALWAEENPFPVEFQYHCGGKAKYSIPKAIGFSSDGKTLGMVYINRLIFVDVATGKGLRQLKISNEFHRVDYNYVAFDPTGKYCVICQIGFDNALLQIFDVEKGIGSAATALQGVNPPDPSHYVSFGYYLPLRQWLAIQMVNDESQATCEAVFATGGAEKAKSYFRISFHGDVLLKKGEQIYTSMGGKQAIKAARNVGAYAGEGMQVALSLDQKTLLAQFIDSRQSYCVYQFRFYDAASKRKLTEIRMLTNIDWRSPQGSRGFAFSPNFRYLARTKPGGHVVVHNLSALSGRKLEDSTPIVIPSGHNIATGG